MKKFLLSLAVGLAAVGAIVAKSDADQVLMTVDGKPVTLGEFEYLYHKNNSQQATPQPIDEYLQMFIIYKQKVADAEAEGIQNTPQFQAEFAGYCSELAEPYMRVSEVEDSLVNAIYERKKEEVQVSHIMLPNQGPERAEQQQRIDSIRTALIQGADFEQLARQYSVDRSVVYNGGNQGFITPLRFPYTFEDAAYETPVGEVSKVIETPFGFHVLKVTARRPARGQVRVQHILKLTQGMSPEEKEVQKAKIDSIYNVLVAGANFDEVAKAESDDPGSSQNGGNLPFFGSGQMVPEFETVAFELADDEISKPFETAYGYHIIHRFEGKGIESFDEAKPQILQAIANDGRGQLPRLRKIQQLKAKYNVVVDSTVLASVTDIFAHPELSDSARVAQMKAVNGTLLTISNQPVDVQEFVATLKTGEGLRKGNVENFARTFVENKMMEFYRADLANENPDYRNLVNEYRDGMLLFEVADKKVWSKAKQDKEGLNAFFQANKQNYTWDQPRYKGYVVFATSDSILNEAKAFLTEHPEITPDQLTNELREKFGKEIKSERVIAAKGENAITDFLGFQGEKPESKGKWAYYFGWFDGVIDQPQEVSDVRGAVTNDYQNALEEVWVKELQKKYPAKVKKNVLKKAK